MGTLSDLKYLLEPSAAVLISTAVIVVILSAYRALLHEKESKNQNDNSVESSISLDGSQAISIPIASSIALIVMFYLFSSISQFLAVFTAVVAATSMAFCLQPYTSKIVYPFCSRRTIGPVRAQFVINVISTVTVVSWLLSGHWMLNNILGISLCAAFVSHVRLPNIRICYILLSCLFMYDIFWVFFSEAIFGANVMVTVATQQSKNPVHTVANQLHIPISNSITKQLDLPVKILIPRSLLFALTHLSVPKLKNYLMLGLGDMAIPGMLASFLASFDHQKLQDLDMLTLAAPNRLSRVKYMWIAVIGYAVGLVLALAAGILTHLPQPALLYIVPCALIPTTITAWRRREFMDLWRGSHDSEFTD